MADAFFQFDTNIEAVVRRVRTGFQELSQTVARQAAQQGGAGVDSGATQQLEQRLSASIQRASRELAQVRAQFEGALRQAGQGGTAARPNDRSLKSEGEQVLNRLRGQLISELTDFGRQFDLPEEQVRSTIVQGVGQLQAGFKALFLAAREDLRRVQADIGAVATTKTFYGSSGLDTTRGLQGSLKDDIQRETRDRAVNVGPQDLLQAELALAQRQARAVFRDAVSGAINPSDARATAEALDQALKQAIRTYVEAVRRAGQRATGFGVEAPKADEGLRGLTDQALRARQALGLGEIPIARGAFPNFSEVKPVRAELQNKALEAAHANAARAAQASAAASRDSAEASGAQARASRQAAVELSKRTADLTPAQAERAIRDTMSDQLGSYLERRATPPQPYVDRSGRVQRAPAGPSVGARVVPMSPGFAIPERGRLYQTTNRALGIGALNREDDQGRLRVATLANRVNEARERRLLVEALAKETAQLEAQARKDRNASEKVTAARRKQQERIDRQTAELELGDTLARQRLQRPQDFTRSGPAIIDTRTGRDGRDLGRVFRTTQGGVGATEVEGKVAEQYLAEARRKQAEAHERAAARVQAQQAKERAASEKLVAAQNASAERSRANRLGNRIRASSDAREAVEAQDQESRRIALEEARARAGTLAAVREGRAAAELTTRLQREVAQGLSQQVAANRFLTPRGLEDARGTAAGTPQEQAAYQLNQRLGQRVLTGEARNLGGGLYLDQALGGFVQVANNKAQVLQGAVTSGQAQRLNAAIDRLRREAEEASRRVATAAPGGAGGGGNRSRFGTALGGFSEGFNSAGFAGGTGSGDLVENLSRTAGLEARFALTYRSLLLLQQGLTDTVQEYLRLSEAEKNLEVALDSGSGVTRQLREDLTDVASVAGESVSVAMDVAARGVRAFTDASKQSASEMAEVAAEFTHAAETLSVIAQQGLEESANEIVAVAQSFNLSEFGNIAEVVAEARRLGGDPDEISSGLANIGVAAREAGLDVRESAAVISSAIAQTGQSGQAVATRLSRVFNTLRGSTGRNVLSGLGIDIEQQPIDQLRELADVFDSLSELDQRAIASKLAGVSNIREFTVLLDSLQSGSRVQDVVAQGFGEGGEAITEYNRRLESTAGQVQLIVGQVRELQQGLIEAGALDVFGAALAVAKPFLQTVNDIISAFNNVLGVVPGLNRLVTVLAQVYAGRALMARLRAQNAAGATTEATAEDSLTGARQRERTAIATLAAALESMSALRNGSIAVTELETAALNQNTIARQRNASVATVPAPPTGGRLPTGTVPTPAGQVRPLPAPPRSGPVVAPLPAPPRAGVIPGIGGRVGAAAAGLRGGALGLLAGAGPAAAATLAVIAFQSLSDALGRVREGTEGADKAMESYIEAQRTLASADFLSAVDSLRNQAAELRESATGITGTIANVLADIGGESLNEQAARLETAAQEAADRAEARREVEISRISQLGEGETIFGTFIDGAEELRIGLETLDDAGSSAVTKVRQVVTALESMAAIDPDDFTVLDRFSTEDLAEQLGSGLATILSGVVGQTLDTVRGEGGLKVASFVSGKDGAPDIYRTLSESFGQELNTAEEVNRAILRFRTENGIGTSVPAETLVQDGLREELLALEGLRDILSNDELLNGLQSTLGSIVEQVAGPDGVLSTEDYQQVIDLAADAIRAEAPEIDDSGLRAALRSYLEGIERSTSPQLTQEVFREATEAVLSNINALPQQLQLLEGASPVESLTEALSYIDSLRDVADLRFDGEFSEELQLAYLQLTEQLLDAQAAVRQAERDLQAARLPTADVAGRRTIEREGLTANLDRARDRNDEQAILEAQTALVEFDRETVEGERERVAAVTRSSIDVRDSAGRLKADIQAATAELEATAQFDSDGNVTQAYAEASEEVAQLLNEQAERQRELAASIARAGIDPRDDVGNARADLDEAEANLAAQLPGTQEFYDAQRDVAEQRIELADRERALANAMARSGIDSRDDVANAAQDVREAQREVDAAIPGTVAFFEALRQLQDAQLAMRTALNARQDAQRRASLDPRDDLGNAAADVKAAQDALDATLPGTEAFFRAQRDLAEASLDLADQQRALADAIDLAGVAPGDEAGEAAARIRIAERALAATLPGTVAFYEALRELREAQAAVAEEQRAVADAQDLASVDSADEVGSAAVRIRIAQRALRNAARGSREYYQALRELKDAQEEMADAQAALRDAIELSRVDPGDEVGQARAELRIAERALRDTARGTREFYEALTAFKQAQRALADAIRARDDARDLAAVFPGSALQGATAQLRVAQRALEAAQVGTTEYYQALGGVREAQVALARAQSNARGNSRLLGTDLTNPIAEAQAQIANLGDMLNALSRLGAPGDVLDEIRLQIQRAKDSLEATQFNEKLSTMRDLVDIGAISDEQYVRYLESEKSRLQGIRNRTYQQNKQLIEIEKALQAANEEVAGQFNLGQIRVPTPFEVRRAIQAAVPGLTEIQNAADAFGTGSSNDPIGNLVDGSVVAVNNLAGHVNNFGNLVASIFGQLGIGGGNGIFGPGGGGGGGASGFDFGSATNWSDVMQGAGGGNPFWQPSSPAPGQAPGWGYGTPGGGWSGTTVTTTSPGPSVRSYSADLQAALNVFDEIASTRSDQMQFKDYLTSDQMRELGEVNTANLMQAFAASGMAYPEVIGGRYRTEVPASSRSYDMSRSSSQQITNTYNVQVDGADFGQVKTLFQRMFGEQVTSSRSAATSRKF